MRASNPAGVPVRHARLPSPSAPSRVQGLGRVALPSTAAPPVPCDAPLQHAPEWVERFSDVPALAGGFAPVAREVACACRVEGRLPADLDGVYVRNGPNPRTAPVDGHHWRAVVALTRGATDAQPAARATAAAPRRHVPPAHAASRFDGHGMLHALRLRPGATTADYECRFVRTAGFEQEVAAGTRVHPSLGKPPQLGPMLRGLAAKFASPAGPDAPFWVVQSPNYSNNGVMWHAGALLSTYEAGSAMRIAAAPGLDTLGVHDFGGSWLASERWTENVCAHGKKDAVTGELIFTSYSLVEAPGLPISITAFVVGRDGRVAHRAQLSARRPVLWHDFAITATRTLLLDGPLVFSLGNSLRGAKPFEFHKESPLAVGVLPRRGCAADVVWIDTEPGFAFHTAAAWDDPGHPDRVVLVLCRMDETRAVGLADALAPVGGGAAAAAAPLISGDAAVFREEGWLHRYVLDVARGCMVESSPLAPDACDFPAIHPHFVGRPVTTAFAAAVRDGPDPIPLFDGLLKHDLVAGTAARRPLPPGHFCGDVVIAPKAAPGGGLCASEADAYVLLLVHVPGEGRAYLLVLDAGADVRAPPVATVHVPVPVPFGFHATFAAAPLPSWP